MTLSRALIVCTLMASPLVGMSAYAENASAGGQEAAECFDNSAGYKRQTVTCGKIIRSKTVDGRPATNRELAMANVNRVSVVARVPHVLKYCNAAIALDPTYVPAYLERGNAYRTDGKFEASLADYTKAMELEPDNIEAYYGRARTYEEMRRPDLALADLTTAIERHPKSHFAYQRRAALYERFGQTEKAIADHRVTLEKAPGDAISEAALRRLGAAR